MLLGLPWWAWIAIVAIVTGAVNEYQKNKMTMINQGKKNSEEVDELRKTVFNLKTRVENLEAIATAEPDEFKGKSNHLDDIEIKDDYDSEKEKNQKTVSKMADKS